MYFPYILYCPAGPSTCILVICKLQCKMFFPFFFVFLPLGGMAGWLGGWLIQNSKLGPLSRSRLNQRRYHHVYSLLSAERSAVVVLLNISKFICVLTAKMFVMPKRLHAFNAPQWNPEIYWKIIILLLLSSPARGQCTFNHFAHRKYKHRQRLLWVVAAGSMQLEFTCGD